MKNIIPFVFLILLFSCSETEELEQDVFTHEMKISESRSIKIVANHMVPDDAMHLLETIAQNILTREVDVEKDSKNFKSGDPVLIQYPFISDIYYWNNYSMDEMVVQTFASMIQNDAAPWIQARIYESRDVRGLSKLDYYNIAEIKSFLSTFDKGKWKLNCMRARLYTSAGYSYDDNILKIRAEEVRLIRPKANCVFSNSNYNETDLLPDGYYFKS